MRYVIFDEADKLFDMGFVKQVDTLIHACNHPNLVRMRSLCVNGSAVHAVVADANTCTLALNREEHPEVDLSTGAEAFCGGRPLVLLCCRAPFQATFQACQCLNIDSSCVCIIWHGHWHLLTSPHVTFVQCGRMSILRMHCVVLCRRFSLVLSPDSECRSIL